MKHSYFSNYFIICSQIFSVFEVAIELLVACQKLIVLIIIKRNFKVTNPALYTYSYRNILMYDILVGKLFL